MFLLRYFLQGNSLPPQYDPHILALAHEMHLIQYTVMAWLGRNNGAEGPQGSTTVASQTSYAAFDHTTPHKAECSDAIPG